MSENPVTIITGAAQGLGRAAALRLASDGARLAIWDVLDEGGRETALRCRAAGADALFRHVDVGDPASVEAATDEAARHLGPPTRLVNNAGIYPRSRALDLDLAQWERVLRVNLTGTFLCAKAAARHMIAEGGGAIVNTASGRAIEGAAQGAHYAASKAGIIALTKSLARDWAPYRIRVNCVIPGLADTAQPRLELSEEELLAAGASIPLGRIARPEDVAGVVAFLLGEDAAYMTGQSVAVNGGSIMLP